MGTGEGWSGGYAKSVVGAAFSVPCVKRPDLLPGLSLCTASILHPLHPAWRDTTAAQDIITIRVAPVAQFTFVVTVVGSFRRIDYTNTSLAGPVATYAWDFGGGAHHRRAV
jgi:hypothetical protein